MLRWWACGAVVIAAAVALSVGALRPHSGLLFDFRPYFCAGAAIVAHRDPYRQEPLRSCESATGTAPLAAPLPEGAVPAPLPPYALAAFAPFARLPFGVAAAVWTSLLLVGALTIVVVVARLGSLSAVPVAAVFAPIVAYSVLLGQPAVLGLAALVAAAAALRAQKHVLVAAALCVTLIEPHVAIASVVTVAVAIRQTRLLLVAGLIACAALSIATVGFATSVEYLRAVVPAHALAGAYDGLNLGATAIAAFAGTDAAAAVAAGTMTSLAMLFVGAIVGVRFARRFDDPAMLALVPPVFMVIGGVHVHVQQIVWALPACLLVAAYAPRARRTLAIAFALVIVPWSQIVKPETLLVAVICAGIIARGFGWETRWYAVAVIPIAAAALIVVAAAFAPHAVAYHPHAYPAQGLAEASWTDYLAQIFLRHDWLRLALRIPTWFGIALAGATLLAIAFPAPRTDPTTAIRFAARGRTA